MGQSEKEQLEAIIKQWNANRLDLFEMTVPNDGLQFSGVVRFYFQDPGQKIATKCVRITSDQTVKDVVEILSTKFRPDMKMLTKSSYILHEIHANGEERCLDEDEKPLLVQLSWNKDDREGRFLLKKLNLKFLDKSVDVCFANNSYEEEESLSSLSFPPKKIKQKLRASKKESKKKDRMNSLSINNQSSATDNVSNEIKNTKFCDPAAMSFNSPTCAHNVRPDNDNSGQQNSSSLYEDMPETAFTRSISNPEAVMRKRRQQKLEKKLKDLQNNGGPEKGGVLKIFGESICPEVPYKTLLLSVNDNALFVIKQTLDKYSLYPDPTNYCLLEILWDCSVENSAPIYKYILKDEDSPLSIALNLPEFIRCEFHLTQKPSNYELLTSKQSSPIPSFLCNIVSSHNTPLHTSPHQSSTSPLLRQESYTQLQHPGNEENPPLDTILDGHVKSDDDDDSVFDGKEFENQRCFPCLVEVQKDGSEILSSGGKQVYTLSSSVVNIGAAANHTLNDKMSDLYKSIFIQLPNALGIRPFHCTIFESQSRGNPSFCIKPAVSDAIVHVNGDKLSKNQIYCIKNEDLISLGEVFTFRFLTSIHSVKNVAVPFNNTQLCHSLNTTSNSLAHPFNENNKDKNFNFNKHHANCIPSQAYSALAIPKSSTPQSEPTKNEELNYEFKEPNKYLIIAQPQHQQDGLHGNSIPRIENWTLPVSIKVLKDRLPDFFYETITGFEPKSHDFQLIPSYILYSFLRSLDYAFSNEGPNKVSSPFKNDPSNVQYVKDDFRTLTYSLNSTFNSLIKFCETSLCTLAFWLANLSELCHFLAEDSELRRELAPEGDAAPPFYSLLFACFSCVVACIRNELLHHLSRAFFQPLFAPHQSLKNEMSMIIHILTSTMSILHSHRVNASLIIQIFSHIFHFLSAWLFNQIVINSPSTLCNQSWGKIIRLRLSQIEIWADKNGLELAVDCHLSKVIQLVELLTMLDVTSVNDAPRITSACFKLNSLQLHAVLSNISTNSPAFEELIGCVVAIAQRSCDEICRQEGKLVTLEEDIQPSNLPFLMPEDGFSSEIIRHMPSSMAFFVETLFNKRIIDYQINKVSSGYWMKLASQFVKDEKLKIDSHLSSHNLSLPSSNSTFQNGTNSSLKKVVIEKSLNGSLGLSIVATKCSPSQTLPAIYVKYLIQDGPAEKSGRLCNGDQILSVNGISLVGLAQEEAASIIQACEKSVELLVLHEEAIPAAPSPPCSSKPYEFYHSSTPPNLSTSDPPPARQKSLEILDMSSMSLNTNDSDMNFNGSRNTPTIIKESTRTNLNPYISSSIQRSKEISLESSGNTSFISPNYVRTANNEYNNHNNNLTNPMNEQNSSSRPSLLKDVPSNSHQNSKYVYALPKTMIPSPKSPSARDKPHVDFFGASHTERHFSTFANCYTDPASFNRLHATPLSNKGPHHQQNHHQHQYTPDSLGTHVVFSAPAYATVSQVNADQAAFSSQKSLGPSTTPSSTLPLETRSTLSSLHSSFTSTPNRLENGLFSTNSLTSLLHSHHSHALGFSAMNQNSIPQTGEVVSNPYKTSGKGQFIHLSERHSPSPTASASISSANPQLYESNSKASPAVSVKPILKTDPYTQDFSHVARSQEGCALRSVGSLGVTLPNPPPRDDSSLQAVPMRAHLASLPMASSEILSGVVGSNEVYTADPLIKRLKNVLESSDKNDEDQNQPERMSFRDKMKKFSSFPSGAPSIICSSIPSSDWSNSSKSKSSKQMEIEHTLGLKT